MKKPSLHSIKSDIETGVKFANERGRPIAEKVYRVGRGAIATKTGKRIATGAFAGGAIAYAIPLMAITTGAILGAGAMLFVKSLSDREG